MLLLPVMLFAGCRKFVAIEPAPNMIASQQVFANDKTAVSAVLGVYQQMRNTIRIITNGGLSIYSSLSADEIYNTASNSTDDPFYKNALAANNSIITSFWTNAYSNIYRINACIEGLSASPTITDSLKTQLTGEMKVVRAVYYFYMVNLFGEVPLVTSTDYRINEKMGRTPASVIINQIIEDLVYAKTVLKQTYPSANRARANKLAAVALLARVYLYDKQWSMAEEEANSVINSGLYNLSSVATVFQPASNETIWQLVNDNANTAEGAAFIPSSSTARPTYAISNFLLSSFENGDLRKTAWLKSNTVSGIQYYYPNKYQLRTNTPVNEYTKLLRLSEVYLIRAEARARQNKIIEGQGDLNVVRNRAGLPDVSMTSQAALLAAVEKERFTELFTEFGHRWFDLKRTDRIDAVLGSEKPGWKTDAALYPIPDAQIQVNNNLSQNPGY